VPRFIPPARSRVRATRRGNRRSPLAALRPRAPSRPGRSNVRIARSLSMMRTCHNRVVHHFECHKNLTPRSRESQRRYAGRMKCLGWINGLRALRCNCDAHLLCTGGSEPMVHPCFRRRVCDGLGLWLPPRCVALRPRRGNLDNRCASAMDASASVTFKLMGGLPAAPWLVAGLRYAAASSDDQGAG
jgi:hypothetical protein